MFPTELNHDILLMLVRAHFYLDLHDSWLFITAKPTIIFVNYKNPFNNHGLVLVINL